MDSQKSSTIIKSEQHADHVINLVLHTWILFTFLTIFFFLYISKIMEKSISNALTDIIDEETPNILDIIDKWTTKIPGSVIEIDWDNVYIYADDLVKKSQGKLQTIQENNIKFRNISIGITAALFVILIGVILYYKYRKGVDIHLGKILIENTAAFGFIGVIEYLFFTRIASKYIPVTTSDIATTILDRVKYRVTQIIHDTAKN